MAFRSDRMRPSRLILAAGFLVISVCAAKAIGGGTDGQSHADEAQNVRGDVKAIFSNAQGKPASIAELISNVRQLVIADKASLKPVIGSLNLASTEEKSAIGTGLGQAALAVIKTDPAYAAEIQEALAAAEDRIAILAFAAVTGNVPIGATAGGGAGGGGAGGSTTGDGPASGSGTGTNGGGGGGTNNPLVVSFGASPGLTLTATPFTTNAFAAGVITNALTSVSP